MSTMLRPEAHDAREPAIPDKTAYYAIWGAVRAAAGLCHGRLKDEKGAHCAVGCLWAVSPLTRLSGRLIDEVTTVNDSVPRLSNARRKKHVLRWLRWKLQEIGMPLSGRRSKAPVGIPCEGGK